MMHLPMAPVRHLLGRRGHLQRLHVGRYFRLISTKTICAASTTLHQLGALLQLQSLSRPASLLLMREIDKCW